MRARYRITVAVALFLAAWSAWAVAAQTEGDAQRGGKLYAENCAVCHGIDGKGRVGASLEAFPGIQVEATLRQTIANGVPGSVMPAWSQASSGPLSDEDIADIAAYVAGILGGTSPIEPAPTYQAPSITALPDIEGNPSQGAVVYNANCAVCHGTRGEGRFGVPLSKSWSGTDPESFVRQVVSQGISGSTMPAWAQAMGGPLEDNEITDVAAFVLTLRPTTPSAAPTPEPPGGPLGLGVSLLILGGLVLLVVIALVIYYRRA